MLKPARNLKRKGKLITFEGPEGSGKTTQLNLLYNCLKEQAVKVVCFREPGSTAAGEKIRDILLNDEKLKICPLCEMFLYQASRAQFVEEKLKPVLKSGYVVLLDRYIDATSAYQGYGEGLDLKLIQTINTIVSLGIKADITFLLDIDAKKGLSRAFEAAGRKDRIEQKCLAFHNRVRKGYLEIAKKNKKIHVIPAQESITVIHEKIRRIIFRCL